MRVRRHEGVRLLVVPLTCALRLAELAALGSVRLNPSVLWALLGAAFALVSWNAWLLVSAQHQNRTLALEIVLRKQHYLQACAQGSVLLYWGWYWREVYDSAPF